MNMKHLLTELDKNKVLLVKPDGTYEYLSFDYELKDSYTYISELLTKSLNCKRFSLLRNRVGEKNGNTSLDVYIDDEGKFNSEENNLANKLFDTENELPGDSIFGNVLFTIRRLIP